MLSISSSQQCNGNVMVNLTQNGCFHFLSHCLVKTSWNEGDKGSSLIERSRIVWAVSCRVRETVQSGSFLSKVSKKESPLVILMSSIVRLQQASKVELARPSWVKVKGALMPTFAQSWLGFEAKPAFVSSCNQRVTILPSQASYKELQIAMHYCKSRLSPIMGKQNTWASIKDK